MTATEQVQHAIYVALAELPPDTPANDIIDAVIQQVGWKTYLAGKQNIDQRIDNLR